MNQYLCKRKLWLFAQGIVMEQNSDTVAEGRLIGETSYADRAITFTEVQVDGIKVDFYDAQRGIVHEVKKSDKMEPAHIAQVKYYLYVLRQHGIAAQSGVIEYPKLRQREVVEYDPQRDEPIIERWISTPYKLVYIILLT